MRVQLRYTVERRGKLFWQPTKDMKARGFQAMPLGPISDDSIAEARRLAAEWDKVRKQPEKVTVYPPGTLGAYYERVTGRYTRKPALWWTKLSPRGREDYHRAWPRIDPVFGRQVVGKVTTEACERFYKAMDDELSPSERYRTIKALKRLLQDAHVRLQVPHESPAANLHNPQAKGRSAIWLGHEIELLSAGAVELGYHGMAVAIRIAWDTLFSPVDVWTLQRGEVKHDRQGWYAHRDRTKTDKEAFGSLSDTTAMLLAMHVAGQPVTLLDSAPVIRQRNGKGYRSKDTFGDDFRAVRAHVFPDDDRKFMDIRRSGNVEADAAGADKETMGQLLANGLADNRFLDETYTPPTVTKAREVAKQRLEGRRLLADEAQRVSRSKSA